MLIKYLRLGRKKLAKNAKKIHEIEEIVLTFCFLSAIIAMDFLVTLCEA